jgi:hypothetical protein
MKLLVKNPTVVGFLIFKCMLNWIMAKNIKGKFSDHWLVNQHQNESLAPCSKKRSVEKNVFLVQPVLYRGAIMLEMGINHD